MTLTARSATAGRGWTQKPAPALLSGPQGKSSPQLKPGQLAGSFLPRLGSLRIHAANALGFEATTIRVRNTSAKSSPEPSKSGVRVVLILLAALALILWLVAADRRHHGHSLSGFLGLYSTIFPVY